MARRRVTGHVQDDLSIRAVCRGSAAQLGGGSGHGATLPSALAARAKMRVHAPARLSYLALFPPPPPFAQLVKDARTGEETSDVEAVMDGRLDPFITAFLRLKGREATAQQLGSWELPS